MTSQQSLLFTNISELNDTPINMDPNLAIQRLLSLVSKFDNDTII